MKSPPAATAAPALVRSFPPLEPASARLLILGSMPGLASLAAGQYYAHPRNRFWPFMAALFGTPPAPTPYQERVAALLARGVALWDVLAACERPGSLDGSIVRVSERANAIAALVERQPALRVIALNGGAAAAAYRRHLQATLPRALEIVALPSTSPANAAMPDSAKLAAWSVLRGLANAPRGQSSAVDPSR